MENIKPRKHKELPPEELRWRCNPDIFDFDSTSDIEPIEGILGQERALKAIKLGVDIKSPGYNIYIAGLSGTGKATTVKRMLEAISSKCPALFDYAYVNNFRDPDRPLLLKFKVGIAQQFRKDFASAIELLKRKIPQALDNESYTSRQSRIIKQYDEKEDNLFKAFEDKLAAENLSLGQIKVEDGARPEIFPVIDDKSVSINQIEEMTQEGKITKDAAQQIVKKYNAYQPELQNVFKKVLKLSQEFQKKLLEIEREAASNVVHGIIDTLIDKYQDEKIANYLKDTIEHVLNNLQVFKGAKPEGEVSPEGFVIDYFKEYEVNVILDNSETKNCPVIIETTPNYMNIFGTIEKVNDGRGGWYSDFTKIKAGSLIRANGGYLVLNVNHLFEESGVWRTLKRVLTYRKLEIQDMPNYFQFASSILKPEPINIDAKVILIGSQNIYAYLSEHEYDFKKIFKVKADFDYEIKRSEHVLIQYARVIKKLIKEENLCDFDKTAMAYVVEIAAKFAGNKNKLTTRFSKMADIVREANFWASHDNAEIVTAHHVRKAYESAKERHGMLESKISDMINENVFLIDVTGKRVGQINGLAVYNADFYSFGRPTRITATVSLGSGSIINVEREAGMSGRHYNKGVLIISGYFKETFGQDMPLSFNANLVFEQSYGTVDGDSASCAEIFALLSTLSGLPIDQGIAVTGSLNQKGDVQPIGDVIEKVEGFYDVCKSRGLTKKQGVIIPVQNVPELMLRDDIVDAVTKKEFHVWPISRVEEGIEILTGIKAGKKLPEGYEAGSVFDLVEKKIRDLYAKARSNRVPNSEPVKKIVKHKRQQKPKTKRKKLIK